MITKINYKYKFHGPHHFEKGTSIKIFVNVNANYFRNCEQFSLSLVYCTILRVSSFCKHLKTNFVFTPQREFSDTANN